ncbi:hypothetical protein M413DRAFT_27575 [Hebeloma cylindrosporum]|uniref:Uncharacterized protein n=1 Tax=Hebeloma cylindrosporum TaxID=76867 RepID=A0A0C3BZM6_HEBCY|nr:hypothetical protein M413DRAFT_27575 [Hebeloma cylindrosporum h7]
MSTTLVNIAETASSTQPFGSQAAEVASPISRILPYLSSLFSASKHAFNLTVSLVKSLLRLSPLPIVLYAIAPVTVFLDLVVAIFILAPYNAAVYLLDVLFPLYVFCGVACITGGLLGLTGRILCRVVINLIRRREEETGDRARSRAVKKRTVKLEEEDRKGKGKERVSPGVQVKLER